MGKYINYICPNCRASLSDGYRRTVFKGGMGLPFTQCKNCSHLVNTGWKPYSQLDFENKLFYWIGAFFTSFVWGIGLGILFTGLIFLAIDKWISHIDDRNFSLFLFLPIPALFFCWQMYTFYLNIDIVENHYTREDCSLEM